MALNTDILNTLTGKLKVLTVIIGVVCIGLTANKYVEVGSEEFFLAIIIICFIISVVWFIILILGVIPESELLKRIDLVYHALGGLFLIISMICWFVSVHKYREIPNRIYVQRIFAGLFGLANGPLYICIAYLLFRDSGVMG